MNVLVIDVGGTHVKVLAYVGLRGLEKYGKKKWRRYVAEAVGRLGAALEPDDIVLGCGNMDKLKKMPPGCRPGDNTNVFRGGFRLWENSPGPARACSRGRRAKATVAKIRKPAPQV